MVWFFPLVGLEAIAIASTAAARNVPATALAARREWQIASVIAALPFLVVVTTSIQTFRRVSEITDTMPSSTSGATNPPSK